MQLGGICTICKYGRIVDSRPFPSSLVCKKYGKQKGFTIGCISFKESKFRAEKEAKWKKIVETYLKRIPLQERKQIALAAVLKRLT